jgi:hypothetical protein
VPLPDNAIVESIRLKVWEQVEKTEHLIQLIPSDRIGWNPQWQSGSSDISHLLGHLLDCLADFCAVFHAAFPQQMGGVLKLRSLPVRRLRPRNQGRAAVNEDGGTLTLHSNCLVRR